MPEIIDIKRSNGVAGQVSFTAKIRYEGEDPSEVTFVGSPEYGGPVVMVTAVQTFVKDPERFGKFGPDWVRNFFAD